ncbi:MAG: hypothetical protein ACEQSB_01125 [Undibacterium sp.]
MYVLRKGMKGSGYCWLSQPPHTSHLSFDRLTEIGQNWGEGHLIKTFESVSEADQFIADHHELSCDTLTVCEMLVTESGLAFVAVVREVAPMATD